MKRYYFSIRRAFKIIFKEIVDIGKVMVYTSQYAVQRLFSTRRASLFSILEPGALPELGIFTNIFSMSTFRMQLLSEKLL